MFTKDFKPKIIKLLKSKKMTKVIYEEIADLIIDRHDEDDSCQFSAFQIQKIVGMWLKCKDCKELMPFEDLELNEGICCFCALKRQKKIDDKNERLRSKQEKSLHNKIIAAARKRDMLLNTQTIMTFMGDDEKEELLQLLTASGELDEDALEKLTTKIQKRTSEFRKQVQK